jgi:hypothetical protein
LNDIFEWFGISIVKTLNQAEFDFLIRMFHRRHVYEHNGGQVDSIYLKKSEDKSVRLNQHLHESIEDQHLLIATLDRVSRTIESGFHEMIEPVESVIEAFRKKENAR